MGEPCDLVVTGGVVVTPAGMARRTVAVRGGRIAALLDANDRPAAAHEIDATLLHVLPGIIDPHVHTRHPGDPDREDFASGTRAAAAGGITTLVEMPISTVPTCSAEAVRRRVQAMQPEALIDFALYGGAGEENIADIAGQAEAGVVAYKTFLQPPPAARASEFRGMWCTDPAALRDVMAAVVETGLRHAFHCENAAMFEALERRLREAGRVDGLAHAESRPPIVEETSVATVLAMAAECRARVHIVHVSSPRSAALVAEARARGVDATIETCPPYLFLTSDALAQHRGYAKCNPPLRSAAEREALWSLVASGAIAVVGTDHSPFLDREKARGDDDIFQAPPGLCGLDIMLPQMLTAVAGGRLTLPHLVRLMSSRPAELFHLRSKGRLEAGADADLTLVDLSAEWRFDRRLAQSKARDTMRAYDGMRLQGRVVSTYVRGTRVFHEGEITAPLGHGQHIRHLGLGSGDCGINGD